MPASLPGAQGYLQAIYADSTREDSLTRTTAEMLEDKDRENRALRLELFNTCRHFGGRLKWIISYYISLQEDQCQQIDSKAGLLIRIFQKEISGLFALKKLKHIS